MSLFQRPDRAVVALAGRRIDPVPTMAVRFPFERVETVRLEVLHCLQHEAAVGLVCSAACGADLVALDAAEELGVPARIVLPFSAKRFRKTSVVDRPPVEFWGTLFDRLTAKARARNDLVELAGYGTDDEAYSAANAAIVAQAQTLAEPNSAWREPPACLLAVAVWDGTPRGPSDATKQFIDLAQAAGFEVKEILTLDTDGTCMRE